MSSPSTSLVAVDFHGDQILTCQQSGHPHVAMRRVVENIGLSWPAQRIKLIEGGARFACSDIATHDASGRVQPMLAMPVAKLPLWLATINPNKIPDPMKRAKIELYQAESAIALHDYWTKGVAVRSDMDGVVTTFDSAAIKAMVGAMKGSVRKALADMVPGMISEAVREMLPALVNERIMSGRLTVVEGVCAVEVVEMAGYGTGHRPKGSSQFVTRRLARFHEDRGVPIRRDRRGLIKARLFDEATARQWLSAGGKVEIDHYIAQRQGQGKLRLVQP